MVVTAPGVRDLRYGGSPMTAVADGVAVAPLPGAPQDLLVTGPDGTILFDGQPRNAATATPSNEPANVLDWPTRGAMESDVLEPAKAAWAAGLGTTVDQLGVKILFAGDTDSGVKYVMGQAWAPGKPAQQVAYDAGGRTAPSRSSGR